MKNSAIAAAIVVLIAYANLVAGQDKAVPPTAGRTNASAAASAPVSEPQPVAGRPGAAGAHGGPAKADARVCLEFPTKMQIIKCSEKYRGVHA